MNIQNIAVIGAGVMGASIAAHITNAGFKVDLLDIVPKDADDRNAIATAAINKMLKTSPSPFMHPKNARLITPGNIEDDLARLATADWVIEAVIENPTIKQTLYQQLIAVCNPHSLISSNTSTIPLSILTRNMPDSFKRRFMITHFFNPPRYMRLLELVAPAEIDPELFDSIKTFADIQLGKGCVICNDSPGFIANRIGTFWIQSGLLEAIAQNLKIEQCDTAMSLFGIPKTGVFGLLDLVGLDLMPHVLKSFRQTLAANERLSLICDVPTLLQSMISQGLTGRKGLGGFYRLQVDANGQKIKQAIDLQSGEYRPSEKFQIHGISRNPNDLRTFLDQDDILNRYTWRLLSDTLTYSASLIPEIAADIDAVDTAMRLGFNWKYGPFELLDILGIDWFVDKLAQDNQPIPALLSNRQNLYRTHNGELQYKDLTDHYQSVPRQAGVLLLSDVKRRGPALLINNSASLWDIGDGIVCLEFHSKMNTLNPDILDLIQQSISLIRQSHLGLVIYNEADNFSAGANLTLLLPAIKQQNWQTVTDIIKLGQQSYQAIKYAPFPVVGAPSGLALGGGCEILLHCDAIVAHAELYIGLVEVGVGLIPGWGGCKELLRRWLGATKRPGGPMPPIAKTFETIALAKVSTSAPEAKKLLFLGHDDDIIMNKDRVLAAAKIRALALADQYQPPEPTPYFLPGNSAWAALDMAIGNLHLNGKASAYDAEVSRQLAGVLSGGDTDITQPLSEQEMLDLELQAFLHLVQQSGTLARLEHMLTTGKPLRN